VTRHPEDAARRTPHPVRPPRGSGDRSFRAFTTDDLDTLTTRAGLTPGQRLRTLAAAAVLGGCRRPI
jgi:hypothetical protein